MRHHLSIACVLALAAAPALAQQQSAATGAGDKDIIANAMSAAPPAVAEKATIVAIDDKGQMRPLRQGSNNFTCMPDNPQTPGNDPMCVDANGMKWAEAWMGKKEPPADLVGFGYMLRGGSDASNTDPHATKPAEGQKWVETGPHVMIFGRNATQTMGYPTEPGDAKSPYVMWGNTPWQHVMIPLGDMPQATAEIPATK